MQKIVDFMNFLRSLTTPAERIDFRIEDVIGKLQKNHLIVHVAQLPAYRFVDLNNAIESFVEKSGDVAKIETQQSESLNELIYNQKPEWSDRTVRKSTKIAWQDGRDSEIYLPMDCFWLCPSNEPENRYVIRLEFNELAQQSRLQIACGTTGAGEEALTRILTLSREHSIYRNQNLQLTYEAGKTDEYGDIEKPDLFQVVYSAIEPVTDEDIVLSEEHLNTLRRNVIELHTRREILSANGVPTRRGVLLHGPPGTGKTYACRYLCSKLPGVTRIVVTGSALVNVGAIFSFARLLQPSLLILEDVDLIFATREINLYSTGLGDLLDQMDGMRSHEDISVVLTTNSIDRLEVAIKDRPGRISQCIFMGPPKADLRRRYVEHHLRNYNAGQLDIDTLVKDTAGATQAFLKELVHRAVQIACERLDNASQRVELRNSDFAEALQEMNSFLEGSGGTIIGFVSQQKK